MATVVCAAASGQEKLSSDRVLDKITVTGSRYSQNVRDSLVSTTIIDRAELERSQTVYLLDALRGRAGIQVSRNGGEGKLSSVYLRGAESDHVVVLVNGVRMGSATAGLFQFSELRVDAIDRVEIIRGPRSSLYGADAIGGVIQIFTRTGTAEPGWSAMAGGGTYQSRQGALSASGGDHVLWAGGVQYFQTEGFNSCRAAAAVEFGGCFTDEPDADGFRNLSGNLSAAYPFDNGGSWQVSGLFTDNANEFDGDFQNEGDSRQQQLQSAISWPIGPRILLDFTLGHAADITDNFKDGQAASAYDTHRWDAGLKAQWRNQGWLLNAGLDALSEEVESSEAFTTDQRENLGVFVLLGRPVGDLDTELSIRLDDNSAYGSELTGALSAGWWWTPALQVSASVGSGFKAPSFNDLYFPGFGNPDLVPEQVRSRELGLRYEHPRGFLSAAVWDSFFDNLVAFDSQTFTPVNIGRARSTGMEVEASWAYREWSLGLGATWLRSVDRETDLAQPRRPGRSGRMSVDYTALKWMAGLDLIGQSRSWDDLANTRELAGWGRVDLRYSLQVVPSWTLGFRLENILDADYETSAFYNEPGRMLMITARYDA